MARRLLAGTLLAVLFALGAPLLPAGELGTPQAAACAFLRRPHAYEADRGRSVYLATLDAASVNALFPGDPFFGLPAMSVGPRGTRTAGEARVPATLLKAIAWVESDLTMASRSVPFESGGAALVSFDCGHGIMQVTSGMTTPMGDANQPSASQTGVATHYAYNIARGAAILAEKWNQAPDLRPIAGIDTGSDPNIIENWYFAVWGYNGFTGPGANRSNHPMDPQLGAWPREQFRCNGSQSRNRYPYQELVWGCAANPPQGLWAPVPASLPNLSMPQWFEPLALANFKFPYAAMDIPTPQPSHFDALPQVASDFRGRILGAPALSVNEDVVRVSLDGVAQGATARVRIANAGTGILSWSATPGENWIVADPPAGVALGPEVSCSGVCTRDGELTITVNPTLLTGSSASGSLVIASPNSAVTRTIRVEVNADFEVGAPGTSRAY